MSLFFSYLMLKYGVNELSKNKFFDLLSKIPYENVSKILRLPLEEDKRPRRAALVLKDFSEKNRGGTCFSLVNLCCQSLGTEGINAFPLKAAASRETFPHYFTVIRHNDDHYLLDPGYLITRPVLIDPEKPVVFNNSVMSFRIIPSRSHYRLDSLSGSQAKKRYDFTIDPVEKADFHEAWAASYKYMNAVTASRVTDGKFIYISGNYTQIREDGNIQKYRSRDRALSCLKEYFGFEKEQILEAEALLKQYNWK